MSKSRSKSSQRWLKDHFADPFVKQAHAAGLRSRAVFKLKQIDEKYKLIKRGIGVVDLGAAPGGWSQYVAEQVGPTGRVIAMDILPMAALADVTFIEGDFTESATYEQLLATLDGKKADLVLSDMAPNISGVKLVDQPKSMYLAELARDFAQQVLAEGGNFLIKLFHGEGFDEYVKSLREVFTKVQIVKPDASRAKSSEVYLLARHYTK